MKIALLNPPWPHVSDPMLWGVRAGSRWPHFQRRVAPGMLPRYVPFPFFLAIAAGVLREEGYDVFLLDAVAENLSMQSFNERVAVFAPDFIFIETSTPSLDHDLRVMMSVRANCPGVITAMGGTHSANMAKELFKYPVAPDFWLVGEYEIPLSRLAMVLTKGGAPDSVPGVMTVNNVSDCRAQAPDVNKLPMPLFESLPIKNYSDPVCGLPSPSAQSWLSRGCPYACTFCVWPQVIYGNRRYRPRSSELALDEVELLLDGYGCESFYFDDDTANIGEVRIVELAEAVRRRSLDRYPWAMMARADCMTPRMLEALAGAGLYSIKYGVESCSSRLLNACEKNTCWERLQDALRRTRELGVKIHLTFTLGLPGETMETIRETVQFALETAPDTAQFSVCTPFPGTEFHEQCRLNGWLISDDWREYLGSGKAVVETPWLRAAQLSEGYNEALSVWNEFLSNRIQFQRDRLKKRLLKVVSEGAKWRFFGDSDCADFLSTDAPAIVRSEITADDSSSVMVVVSMHDEEKIKRRLISQYGSCVKLLCLFDA